MKIAICDDSAAFLAQTKQLLDAWAQPDFRLSVSTFSDGVSLLRAHGAAPFDVILLDVVMPMLNGIETARRIRSSDKSVKLVFLTSSPEFAVDSYTVKASNYLLKPLVPEKLTACLEELRQELQQSARAIAIRSANTMHRIPLDTIEYVEAQNKHTVFTLTDQRTILSSDPLYAHENTLLLEDGFFKCSRSYIVNIYRIDAYTPKEIRMMSGCRIPISRNRHKEFEGAYFSAIFGRAGDDL